MMLRGMDICAGSGIGSACFEAIGFCRTICYVERDEACQQLLQQRMRDGWLSPAPIWDDLRTFDGTEWRGRIDFMFGGIPCQPWSVAGKGEGSSDERDLWPAFRRVLCEVEPRVALVENVPGLLAARHVRDGIGRILGELAEVGYHGEWFVLSAGDLGAPHERKRVWIIAYRLDSCTDADGERWRRWPRELFPQSSEGQSAGLCGPTYWQAVPVPGVLGVAHGMAYRMDRTRIAGNGWVPQVAAVVAGVLSARLGIGPERVIYGAPSGARHNA